MYKTHKRLFITIITVIIMTIIGALIYFMLQTNREKELELFGTEFVLEEVIDYEQKPL